MAEWSTRFEMANRTTPFTEEQAEALLDALDRYAPAVSYGSSELAVRLTLEAPSHGRAVILGTIALIKALSKTGIKRANIVEAEASRVDDLERDLAKSNAPELVGVAEVAKLLNVSKQRASALAESRGFPHPIAELASGPIWRLNSLVRYIGRWPRKPGRPKKRPAEATA